MTFHGHVHNGVVVLDTTPPLPEGTQVRVEVIHKGHETDQTEARQGGQYAGRIWMAPDFDEWPEDLREALGMAP